MADHHLLASPETCHRGYLDARQAPILRITQTENGHKGVPCMLEKRFLVPAGRGPDAVRSAWRRAAVCNPTLLDQHPVGFGGRSLAGGGGGVVSVSHGRCPLSSVAMS